MVLGLRSKHRRGASAKINYTVHVEDIRPWPPSESLRSVQTVLLQWENGNQHLGSFLSTAQDSKIVFNESFRLPLILYQDKKAHDKFQKNNLEFSLFLPRKDKGRGQLLGTALINLADYGIVEGILSINVLINLKKSSNNSMQPVLRLSLESIDKDSNNSSPNVGLSKQTSLDNDNDNLEIASFTDEDASSQSSMTASSTFDVSTSSPSRIEKNGYGDTGFYPEERTNRQPLSTDASADAGNHKNDSISFSKFNERSRKSVKNSESPLLRSSLSSISYQDVNAKAKSNVASFLHESVSLNSDKVIADSRYKATENMQQPVVGRSCEESESEAQEKELPEEDEQNKDADAGQVNAEKKREQETDIESDDTIMEMTGHYVKSVKKRGSLKGNGFPSDIYARNKEIDLEMHKASQKNGELGAINGRKKPQAELSDCTNEWKTRAKMLEEELREAAATEIGLYSVVAEHASSANKVHTPARRLLRFYNNACKAGSQVKRASAARAAVSGLVLVSKSCGHDVPRLTFWLSNAIMLRAIVSTTAAEFPHYDLPERKLNGTGIDESDDREDVSIFIIALEKLNRGSFLEFLNLYGGRLFYSSTFTPHMQPTAAKVSDVTSSSGTKKTCGRRNSLGNHEQGSFSTELWKKAFNDACERLCPLRAGGHECGCLSVLVRLVMEQLVDRLDMAMFNAILRESAEEMPTDPLSDPISDSNVLPILAGKSSFGAGVELKNSIGNWSRWLTDLFGLDDDSLEHSDVYGDGKRPKSFKAFRLLHALSDLMMLPFGMLADASTRKEVCPMFGPTIIKRVLSSFVPDEFCPDPIPQNIIDSLETEEEVLEASGDLLTSFPCTASPTKYTPPSAALLTCVGEVGNQVLQSSRLSTLKKSYNSDDELDELDSPFTSIVPDSLQSSALAKLGLIAKEKGGRNVGRYQLLREMWEDDE